MDNTQRAVPDEELIVYVNEDGTPTGETAPKLVAHHAQTRLHLAFSCYVFNERGQLLVTQRAHSKKVWPGVWTNSVCGHPAPGEPPANAIARRLHDELGMQASKPQVVLPRYRYQTPLFHGIKENEFCPVFVARATSEPHPNAAEVADYTWLNWDEFVQQATQDDQDKWSWWCKDQIAQLQESAVFRTFRDRLTK